MAKTATSSFKASLRLYGVPEVKEVWVEVSASTLDELDEEIQKVIAWAKEKYPMSSADYGPNPFAVYRGP